MSDIASVNVVRAQIARAVEIMGRIEAGYTEQQKAWLANMRDRLQSRVEQRRERIALAVFDPDTTNSTNFLAKIRLVEEILDSMECDWERK